MTATVLFALAFNFVRIYTGGFNDDTGLGVQPSPYGSPQHCHSFDKYVPFAEYGTAHPEWFSYVKATGRRNCGQGGGQLCFTNRELREFMKGRLKGYILEDRRKVSAAGRKPPRIYDISQNDNVVHCECEQCLAARERWGLSGLLVDFINDIASSVTNEFPDVLVNTFAYQGAKYFEGDTRPSRVYVDRVVLVEP